jgi:hypothetical protein
LWHPFGWSTQGRLSGTARGHGADWPPARADYDTGRRLVNEKKDPGKATTTAGQQPE